VLTGSCYNHVMENVIQMHTFQVPDTSMEVWQTMLYLFLTTDVR